MKSKLPLIILLLIPLLIGSAPVTIISSPVPDDPVEATTYVYEYDPDNPVPLEVVSPNAVLTDVAVHGTLWRAEKPNKFSKFKNFGWGIWTKVKIPGNQWVHITVPLITQDESLTSKISRVEFCAKSSNGAKTKPTAIHLWSQGVKFSAHTISWPAVNTIHCAGIKFLTATWREDLGISVLIYYKNITHEVTLYKAWVRTVK